MLNMGRRHAAAIAAAPGHGSGTTGHDGQDDEAKVRTYLRILLGSPVRASDRLESAEAAFIDVAAGWSERSGVDRKTLADLGVPRGVLDSAGIAATRVGELVRRQYGQDPFTAADLVRKAGVSLASVRTVLAEDERTRRIKRVKSEGRAIHYGLR